MKDIKKIIEKLKKNCGKETSILKNLDFNRWKYIENTKNSYCVLMKNPEISENIVLFGFINFPNNLEVAKDLFKKIENFAKSFSGKKLVGPINYSTWFSYRWMIKGFEETKIYNEPSNPKYFPEIARKLGYKEYKNYCSTLVRSYDSKAKYYREKYKKILERGYSFKRYKGFKIYFILQDIYKISINSFTENPLYSPISYKDFKKIYVSGFNKKVKLNPVVDMCFYKKEPVGFTFTFKNPYGDNIWVWKTIGIKKSFQNKGIGSAFRYIIHKTAIENNCDFVLHHLTYIDNIVKKLRDKKDKNFKNYALFYKNL